MCSQRWTPETCRKWASFRQASDEKSAEKKMTRTQRKIKCMRLCQKLIYGFGLVLLILILLIQTVQCLRKYYEEPTFISTEIVKQDKAEFPALTFCPEGGGYKLDVLQVTSFPPP